MQNRTDGPDNRRTGSYIADDFCNRRRTDGCAPEWLQVNAITRGRQKAPRRRGTGCRFVLISSDFKFMNKIKSPARRCRSRAATKKRAGHKRVEALCDNNNGASGDNNDNNNIIIIFAPCAPEPASSSFIRHLQPVLAFACAQWLIRLAPDFCPGRRRWSATCYRGAPSPSGPSQSECLGGADVRAPKG